MSEETAAYQIAKRNQERHNHANRHSSRCRRCGSYVSKPAPENGQVRYYCPSCERYQLEWVGQTQTATSD